MALPPGTAHSTCLITGASAGIGAELARELAGRGHGVTLVARREDRLQVLAAELRANCGVRVNVFACDLGDPGAREELETYLTNLELSVEVLCNNAGFGSAGRFVKLNRERELELLQLNCEALVDLCGRYAPQMAGRGRGAILNVASTAAFQPLPGQATYAASKAMVLSFTEALHQELASSGVSVTALCPGPVKTEFAEVAGMTGIEAATPGFIWATAAQVAQAALRGLEKNDRAVVPGAVNGLGAMIGRHAPRGLFLRAASRFYPVGRE